MNDFSPNDTNNKNNHKYLLSTGNSEKLADRVWDYAQQINMLHTILLETEKLDEQNEILKQQLQISMDAVTLSARLIKDIGDQLEAPDLFRVFIPLMDSLKTLNDTGSTPKLLASRSGYGNRPRDSLQKITLKTYTVLIYELYKTAGISSKPAKLRILKIYEENTKSPELKSPSTLKGWIKNCKPGEKWHDDYKSVIKHFFLHKRKLLDTEMRNLGFAQVIHTTRQEDALPVLSKVEIDNMLKKAIIEKRTIISKD